ncbi:hypothetical protein BpHYR1_052564 [Brachionus plicatilis]|uniref:Uncharacterized protein n=1 Tax=Brachionus plicatilis TaxID=10195 RepID=A0A3M7P959_BRAPC|nr:hypothetical protein BpHYR1_052564 [Brachionus plicatilis]
MPHLENKNTFKYSLPRRHYNTLQLEDIDVMNLVSQCNYRQLIIDFKTLKNFTHFSELVVVRCGKPFNSTEPLLNLSDEMTHKTIFGGLRRHFSHLLRIITINQLKISTPFRTVNVAERGIRCCISPLVAGSLSSEDSSSEVSKPQTNSSNGG